MKVLVTTPTGTVGQCVIRELLEKKLDVFGTVRDPTTAESKSLTQQGVHLIQVDYEKPETLDKALEGIEKVVLISPFNADHQKVSQLWVEALKKAKGVKHVIRLSHKGADDPKHLVASWHAFIEVLIKVADLPCTTIRPNIFFQNLGNFFAVPVNTHSQFINPLSDVKVAYLDVRDLAKVIAIVTSNDEHIGQVIELNGPRSLSGSDIADSIGKVIGKKVEYVDPPIDQWKEALTGIMPDLMLEAVVELFQAMQQNKQSHDSADESVKKITGKDAITVEQYVQDHIALFKGH